MDLNVNLDVNILKVLDDIKRTYNKYNYSEQNYTRLSFSQLVQWLSDVHTGKGNRVLIGSLYFNPMQLRRLNTIIAATDPLLQISAIASNFYGLTNTLAVQSLETELLWTTPSGTSINTEQYVCRQIVFNKLLIGFDISGVVVSQLFYPDDTTNVVWYRFDVWYAAVQAILIAAGYSLESFISFRGYEATISTTAS